MLRTQFVLPSLLPAGVPGPHYHALALVGNLAGFTATEIRLGLAAAHDRLASCGVDTAQAWQAVQAREHGQAFDGPAFDAWEEAEQSALLVASIDRGEMPLGVMLTFRG